MNRVNGTALLANVDLIDAPPHGGIVARVLILLTNDDGVYAPGLAALERALRPLGEVILVAPATEQSGVGHAITYLTPLIAQEVFDAPRAERRRGWSVQGSPADCVKLGITEFCPRRPDLVVSGINSGLNAGINVLYSGTVAAAIEGAFFEITSVAVSLEHSEHARYDQAAEIAVRVIQKILEQQTAASQLYNLNIPSAALGRPPQVHVVPMGVSRYGEDFEKRIDPRGRSYYWATNEPPPPRPPGPIVETDLTALKQGFVTLTPLNFNMTHGPMLETMRGWAW